MQKRPTYGGGTDHHPEYRVTPNGLEPPEKLRPWTRMYMGNMVRTPLFGLAMTFMIAFMLPYIDNYGWLGSSYASSKDMGSPPANVFEAVSVVLGFVAMMVVAIVSMYLALYALIVLAAVLCFASVALWCCGAVFRAVETVAGSASVGTHEFHVAYYLLPLITLAMAVMLRGVWKGHEWATRANGNEFYELVRRLWIRNYNGMLSVPPPYERVSRRDVGWKRWLMLGCTGAFVVFMFTPALDQMSGWKYLSILITTGQFLGFDTEWVFLVLASLGVVVLGAWIVMSNRAGNAVYWAWLLVCLGHWFWVLGTFVRAADGCASGAENCYSSGYYALFLISLAASIVLYLINNDRDAHESANAEWRQALREQGGGDGNA